MAYDNSVPKFEASQYLITNGEFLEFVNAGGYEKEEFWTAEGKIMYVKVICMLQLMCSGWKWVKFCEAKHPTFWVCQDGCKSRCGAALAGYSHCQLSKGAETENNHTLSNGTTNGNISNGGINGMPTDRYR